MIEFPGQGRLEAWSKWCLMALPWFLVLALAPRTQVTGQGPFVLLPLAAQGTHALGEKPHLLLHFPLFFPQSISFDITLSLTLQKNNLKKTYLTVNPNAIIIVSPLIWRKRNSDSEGQAGNEAVFLKDKRAVVAAYYTCVPSRPATWKVTIQRERHGEQATGRAYRFHILDLKVFGLRG